MSLRSHQSAAATDWTPPSDRESERVIGQSRMAAMSGVVFAVLLVVALVLVETGPKLDDPDSRYTSFYTNGSGGTLVTLGVYVVPFAGIAFLWHVVATRTLLQVLRPGSWADPAHWLQLASGLVFVCMLFGASAAVGAVALLTRFSVHPLPPPDVARSLSAVGYGLAFVFGVRAAGMYMIATTRLASRGWRVATRGRARQLRRGGVPAGQHHLPPRDPAGVPSLGAHGEHRAACAPADGPHSVSERACPNGSR